MRTQASLVVICAAGLLAGGCVPKARVDQQRLETDSCYSALQRENLRKKELSRAVAEQYLPAGPDSPVPAPRATTGTFSALQTRSTDATCSTCSGSTTSSGRVRYMDKPSHS